MWQSSVVSLPTSRPHAAGSIWPRRAAPRRSGTRPGRRLDGVPASSPWGPWACLVLVGDPLSFIVEDSHAQHDCGFCNHRATGLPPRSNSNPARTPFGITAYPQWAKMVKSTPRHHCRSDPVQVQSTSRFCASLLGAFSVLLQRPVYLIVVFSPSTPARLCLLPD